MGEQFFYVNSHLGPLFVVLDTRRKFAYFEKHWPKSLQTSTKKEFEKMVRGERLPIEPIFCKYWHSFGFKRWYVASRTYPPTPVHTSVPKIIYDAARGGEERTLLQP
jgi:hypothetical protein